MSWTDIVYTMQKTQDDPACIFFSARKTKTSRKHLMDNRIISTAEIGKKSSSLAKLVLIK